MDGHGFGERGSRRARKPASIRFRPLPQAAHTQSLQRPTGTMDSARSSLYWRPRWHRLCPWHKYAAGRFACWPRRRGFCQLRAGGPRLPGNSRQRVSRESLCGYRHWSYRRRPSSLFRAMGQRRPFGCNARWLVASIWGALFSIWRSPPASATRRGLACSWVQPGRASSLIRNSGFAHPVLPWQLTSRSRRTATPPLNSSVSR